ncbi:MAG: 8-amino-7-oxononanoate synthase [Candidatus Omnitrophica bacterium]|nr:8-amino-7-oxononanoate synthase [Candidatus Omnitrophota bacterium]
MFNFDYLLRQELEELKALGLYRETKRINTIQGPEVIIDGKKVILLSSNNYLGLASHPEVIKAQAWALEEFGAGACASRLVSGNMSLHEELEERIAAFKGTEEAIVFPTGYMANVGTISAASGEKDLIVCDKLNHASIIDGARLSGATLRTYPHKNIERLEDILKKATSYRRKIIISDGIFSMDGDIALLPQLLELAERFDAILMLDDAHATGVLGKTGRGTCEHYGIKKGVHIQMGTLSKAIGNLGGFIAGSRFLVDYIRNKARSFIYSTALPPAILGGSIKAIDIAEKDPGLRERLWVNIRKFRSALQELDFNIMGSETQIIPIYIKDAPTAMKVSEFLFKNGIFAPGIRPPTVPKAKCRIRTSLMATHTEEHIDNVVGVFRRLKNERFFCNRD